MDVSPQGLATAANCFESCIPDGYQPALHTFLLAQIANAVAGTSTDPKVLAGLASCFRCLDGTQAAVQSFLLSQISNAPIAQGTGSLFTGVGSPIGKGPPISTAGEGSRYIDTNNGTEYYFYLGVWH